MNLSEQRARTVQQQEQIGRRESIIDPRRDTRAPAFSPSQDLRSARRGDVGGADALLRTLGLVENAGNDLQTYLTNKTIDEEKDNITRGAFDVQNNSVDEALIEKSRGYRNAVTKGRTVNAFASASREFDEELSKIIDDQTDPDLEVRLAEINQRVEGFFRDFAQDPETGELRDYLQSPGAMRYLAETIQSTRPKALAAAQERVEKVFKEEAFSHFGTNITNQAIETGTVDLAAARTLLPDIVTDEEFAENALLSVANAARALEEEGRFAEAAGLIAGLRQRTRAPIETGVNVSSASGIPAAPSAAIPENAEAVLRLPVQGTITSAFGEGRKRGTHNGVDIAVPSGTPVPAAMGGEVIRAWTADDGGVSLKVKYDDGTVAGFAHLSEQAIKEGRFEAGAILAKTGNTGRSTGPHLHYTLTRDGKRIDPTKATLGSVPQPQQAPAAQGTPAAPAPFRLNDPNADPISRLEQSGELVDIVGIEDIQFSPEQVSQIDALYEQSTDRMRRKWRTKLAEDQSVNSTRLALGLSGIGGRVTTQADVVRAFEAGDIDPEGAMQLVRMIEVQADRRAAEQERAENRAEREERKAIERRSREGAEAILGRLARGDLTPAQARSAALRASARIPNSEIAFNILSTVNSVAGAYESTVTNSEPVRNRLGKLEELAEDPATNLQIAAPGINQYQVKAFAPEYKAIVDRASGRYLRDITSGVDPEVAEINSQAFLIEEQAKLVSRIKPAKR